MLLPDLVPISFMEASTNFYATAPWTRETILIRARFLPSREHSLAAPSAARSLRIRLSSSVTTKEFGREKASRNLRRFRRSRRGTDFCVPNPQTVHAHRTRHL